jgi:hypothetical protein
MSKCSPGVARVGFLTWLRLTASDELRVVFVLVTNFVLAVSCLQLPFLYQLQISHPIARESFGFFHIPHRSFNCRRESPFHGLACLLRLWDIPSPYGAGLPVEDAQLQVIS